MKAIRSVLKFSRRSFSSKPESALRERLVQLMPQRIDELKQVQTKYGEKVLGHSTVSQAIGGMRDIKSMLWEPSLLDAHEGIRFRGYSIPEIQKLLPNKYNNTTGQPLPEGILWLLLTGEVPTASQVKAVTEELHRRSQLPAHVEPLIRSLPKGMHPMTQLSIAVMAMQTESEFAKAYDRGIHKKHYWEPTFEDALNLIARLPRVAALIYRKSFHDGAIVDSDPNLDYAANFSRMLGFGPNGKLQASSPSAPHPDGFDEMMRLYLTIHTDHEGGNVSAHTTHLVGSALADSYQSFAAGLNGLAGPLHGLANQEVLRWTLNFQQTLKNQGKPVNKDTVREQAWATLKSGNVIPGFGHAVLRKTDPRYMVQREFAQRYLPEDPLFQLVSTIFEVVPQVLTEHGKTKNPWPNVDAHSGCLLTYYGLTEFDYYTVLFGVSRAMGVMSQLFWSRAYGLPIERPKSVTLQYIREHFEKEHANAQHQGHGHKGH